jgi:hypothetical protein
VNQFENTVDPRSDDLTEYAMAREGIEARDLIPK